MPNKLIIMPVDRLYNEQLAILTHFLHNRGNKYSQFHKQQIIKAAREYICRKDKETINTMTDEDLWKNLKELNLT